MPTPPTGAATAARSLAPTLAARARETEASRALPPETVQALHDRGLFRLLQPTRVGGLEQDFGGLVEVASALARGCAATAWVQANLASHHWMLGMWPPAAQDDVWGAPGGADTLIGGALSFPCGRALAVAGGYRLSGCWSFASGIDLCNWTLLGAIVQEEDSLSAQSGEYRLFLVPRADYAVADTWFVAGLAGTASKEIRVDARFVPAHRSLALHQVHGGATPGSAVNPGPLYRIPLLTAFGYVVAGVPLGIARGALDLFTLRGGDRLATHSGRPLLDFEPVQLKVAEAAASVDAAHALLVTNCAQIMATAAGGTADEETRARWRRDAAFAVRLAVRAVDLLFEASGGGGLFLDHPIQRAFRDVHAAASHIALNWDAAATLYGKVALGHSSDLLPFER